MPAALPVPIPTLQMNPGDVLGPFPMGALSAMPNGWSVDLAIASWTAGVAGPAQVVLAVIVEESPDGTNWFDSQTVEIGDDYKLTSWSMWRFAPRFPNGMSRVTFIASKACSISGSLSVR